MYRTTNIYICFGDYRIVRKTLRFIKVQKNIQKLKRVKVKSHKKYKIN